ncbi:MAG: cytochrome b [Alphaproteobacteria bacterium CG11_big_fil_rev_8_21_14_0_20_39_49]|nr:MAG: cytochrome b [Alphaproteobacteria bacterium CG11_big_fil_rev_8_21_14_0_20_39_49]
MKNTKNWSVVIITIHWLTVICVIGLFAVGWWMTELDYYSKWYRTAPFIHKSIGITLLIVTAFRLLYKLKTGSPAPLPSHKPIEVKLAHLMHKALYALLFAVLFSGYFISTADGRPISVFNLFEVPALPWSIDKQEDIAGDIHFFLACFLIGFASLHALAALKHHFIEKDETLKRMLRLKRDKNKD